MLLPDTTFVAIWCRSAFPTCSTFATFVVAHSPGAFLIWLAVAVTIGRPDLRRDDLDGGWTDSTTDAAHDCDGNGSDLRRSVINRQALYK